MGSNLIVEFNELEKQLMIELVRSKKQEYLSIALKTDTLNDILRKLGAKIYEE